jgi:hypothetical protein
MGSFTLSGSNFSLSGNFGVSSWGPAGCSVGCDHGSSLSVNGVVIGNDFTSGPAVVEGVAYPSLNWGSLFAEGPSFFEMTGPPIQLDAGPGAYTGVFSFSGSLCGTISGSGIPEPCMADFPVLTGAGAVAVTLIANSMGTLTYTEATYTFIPEPAGAVLMLAALAFVIVAKNE